MRDAAESGKFVSSVFDAHDLRRGLPLPHDRILLHTVLTSDCDISTSTGRVWRNAYPRGCLETGPPAASWIWSQDAVADRAVERATGLLCVGRKGTSPAREKGNLPTQV
jgi:hypothetical protein